MSLPWIEKYRPKTMDEMIDHVEKITTLRNLIKKNELPHLLFYGPPGTGKTSLILTVAREMYGPEYKMYILELNASDDRGIDIVRNKIPNFVKTKSDKPRLVILDEADAMTQDAQSALRRVMEKYIKQSRFCLIGNNINKIIPGIQSRCNKMRFGCLAISEVKAKVDDIVKKEGVLITDEGVKSLITIQKDFRQTLNTLQGLHSIRLGDFGHNKSLEVEESNDSIVHDYEPITKNDVHYYLGKPTEEEIEEIVDMMFNGNFQETYEHLIKIFRENRWNIQDLITYLGEKVVKMELSDDRKFYLLQKLSKIDYRTSVGRDSDIQLAALVGAFLRSKIKCS